MFRITDNPVTNKMTATVFKQAIKNTDLTLAPFDPATIPAPAFTPATAEQVSDAAHAAALAGKDPSTDKEVQRLLTSHQLGKTIGGFHHRNEVAVSRGELEYYQDNAPALLEELAAKFATAVETMREQIPIIGHASLADSMRELDTMRDNKATATVLAHTANTRAMRMVEALSTIVSAVDGRTLGLGHNNDLLAYVSCSAEEYNTHRLTGGSSRGNNHGRKHNVWDMLNDGLTIELATTPEEVQRRIKRIDDENNKRSRNHNLEAMMQSMADTQAASFPM